MKLPVVCLLIFGLILGTTFTAHASWGDRLRSIRNFFTLTRDIGGMAIDSVANPGADDLDKAEDELLRNRQEEENRLFDAEDPDRVRILRNDFFSYDWLERHNRNIRETIELKVTPSRIRPGESVRFEAVPSPETPPLPRSVFLSANPSSHNTTISRWWFGKIYSGSLRFKPTDSGVYNFHISTFPRYDAKEGRMISHNSNSVNVVVAPDISRLYEIYLVKAPSSRIMGQIYIREGATTRLRLHATGLGGEKFDITASETGTRWTVGDESIATIEEERYDILLKGLVPGQTTLNARYGSMEFQIHVNVVLPPAEYVIHYWISSPRSIAPNDDTTIYLGDTIQFVVSPDVRIHGPNPLVEWRFVKITRSIVRPMHYAALPNYGHVFEWTPTEEGVYDWHVRYVYSMTSEDVEASNWSRPHRRLFVTRPGNRNSLAGTFGVFLYNILPNASLPRDLNRDNLIVVREPAENIPTESSIPPQPVPPPPAERPKPINPPEGFVGRVGERLHLEVTPFDLSTGYTFHRSRWLVHRVNPQTGKRGATVAELRNGNSEKAEWIPGRAGTFEWEVIYHYTRPGALWLPEISAQATSFPQRIVVEE